MAALDFPASPTVGQIYTANGRSWKWDGVSWISANQITSIGVTGSTLTIYGSPIAHPDATSMTFANSVTLTAASTKTLTLNGGAGSNGLAIDASNNINIGYVGSLNFSARLRALASSGLNTNNVVCELYAQGSGYNSKLMLSNDNGSAGIGSVNSNDLAFYVSTSVTEKMRLDSSGNLGLGVTPSAWVSNRKVLQVGGLASAALALNGTGAVGEMFFNCYQNTSGTYNYSQSSYAAIVDFNSSTAGGFTWRLAGSGTGGGSCVPSSAMTLDASGNLIVGDTAITYSERFAILKNVSNDLFTFRNSAASAPYGGYIKFTAAAPNNGTSYFLLGSDSSATRCILYSNGGIANFSANNTNISDERVKKEIALAPSWLAKINAIEVVNFKYKDQTHDDFNLGAIAQQVRSVAPELVDVDGFGATPEDGIPLMTIYETDLKYAMLKAIQELSQEIETLKQKVN